MGSSSNWSWVTANGGWMLTVNLEFCRTELAFNFTCRERERCSKEQPKGEIKAAEATHLYGH